MKNKDFRIMLSMGHDTDLHSIIYDIVAKDKYSAYQLAWENMQNQFPEKIKEIYKRKGLHYSPYFLFMKIREL